MDLKDIVHDPARLQIFDIFLEEACRQWYAFIEEDLDRADGEGFAGFFYEIFEMKENEMLEDLNAHVNASVERILAGDRTKLPVTNVTSEALMQELADYRKSGARADAVQQFMSGRERKRASFVSCYHVDHLAGDSMAAYLEDPDKYIEAQAEDYIKNSGEKLLVQFLKSDALAAELAQINSEADSPLHRMRAITNALYQSRAETVCVTIQKDGELLSFQAPVRTLEGYQESYSAWEITAPDRKDFARLIGEQGTYQAEDIVQITDGQSVLYTAPAHQTQDMAEDAAMGGMSL